MAEEYFVVWDHICGTYITLPGHSELEGDSPRDWMADVSKNFLFAWSSKGILLVWETQSFVLVHTYRPVALSNQTEYHSKIVVHVSVDETWLLAHSYKSTYEVCVWDTATWTLHAILPPHENHNTHKRSTVAFMEGETSIVAACDCGAMQKYDFRAGRLLHNTYLVDSAGSPVREHSSGATQLSPNGHRICWAKGGSGNQVVNMSDAETGALLWSVGSISPYLDGILQILFSQDGRYVGVEYQSQNVFRVWRVEDGECVVSERKEYDHGFWQFSRDGKVLVVGDFDKPLDTFRVIEL